MSLDIKALRAKLKSTQTSTSNYESSSIFSFSKLNIGDQVRIRFIEDGEKNDVFWRPHCTRTLRFDKIRLANGQEVENKTYVSVPAFNLKKGDTAIFELPTEYLYNSGDDVLNAKIKPFWDGTPEGQALYNRYGRTERYVFQGFVRSEGYEPKLYRFVINKELYKVISSFADDDEIQSMPSDPEHGRDFILKVTSKIANINGKPQEVKDYSTSKWSNAETPLNETEKNWLETNKPYVLKNFTPIRPTVEQEKVMLEMFEATLNDEPYDVVRWGKIFKPDNVFFDEQGNIKDLKNKSTMTNAQEIPAAPTVAQPSAPQVAPQPTTAGFSVEQMQAMLAQMQAAQQTTAQPTAPQLINQHTEEVVGDNPNAIIADIMGKFHN